MMKLIIDIPKEFESDYNGDLFKDFFSRVLCDIQQNGTICGNYEKEIAEMFLKAFDESKKMDNNGWIPCSERLPEVNNFVLVESEHGIWIVRLIEYGNRKYFVDIYNDYSCPIDSVLAWQPLPKPYKESDTNGKN